MAEKIKRMGAGDPNYVKNMIKMGKKSSGGPKISAPEGGRLQDVKPKAKAKNVMPTVKVSKKELKAFKKEVTKPVKKAARKSDGMLSSKEAGKVYKKAINKKGKFDPTKIPGFSYGKGTR
jgi:hypothetical protein